jgi:hypothetical protein
MTAPARIEVTADPFPVVRALNRLRTAGVVVELDGTQLAVSADTVYSALAQAGSCGLDWREGTPADWTDARLLAADDVLYGDGRMVNRDGRRYQAVELGNPCAVF